MFARLRAGVAGIICTLVLTSAACSQFAVSIAPVRELDVIAEQVSAQGSTIMINAYRFSGSMREPSLSFQGKIFGRNSTLINDWTDFVIFHGECLSAKILARSHDLEFEEADALAANFRQTLPTALSAVEMWDTAVFGYQRPCLTLEFYLVKPDERIALNLTERTENGRLSFPVLGNLPEKPESLPQWTIDALTTAAHEISHLRSFQFGGFSDPVSEEAAAYLQQRCVELKLRGKVGPRFVRLEGDDNQELDRRRATELLPLLENSEVHPSLRGMVLAQLIFSSDVSSDTVELGTPGAEVLFAQCVRFGRTRPAILDECRTGRVMCRSFFGE